MEKKEPFRPFSLFLSVVLIGAAYVYLNLAHVRAAYGAWDKSLHTLVFFLIWWLARWSLACSTISVALLVIAGGGAEEVHQIWQPEHVADWFDWFADIAGVSLAILLQWLWRSFGRLNFQSSHLKHLLWPEPR